MTGVSHFGNLPVYGRQGPYPAAAAGINMKSFRGTIEEMRERADAWIAQVEDAWKKRGQLPKKGR